MSKSFSGVVSCSSEAPASSAVRHSDRPSPLGSTGGSRRVIVGLRIMWRYPRRVGSDPVMLFANVADGVHRIEDANTNWYLVEDESGVTVVDCGVPSSWDSLVDALPRIGRTPRDVRAIVLTH